MNMNWRLISIICSAISVGGALALIIFYKPTFFTGLIIGVGVMNMAYQIFGYGDKG